MLRGRGAGRSYHEPVEAEITVTVVTAVAAASFLIGLAKGGLPGLGPVITVLVALAVPATVALGVLLPLLMVGDVAALWALRGHVERSIVTTLLPGAVVGVGLASMVLTSLSPEALEVGIVVVVLLFAAYRAAVLSGREPGLGVSRAVASNAGGTAAGFAAGITSTVAHSGGPPIAIHLLAHNLAPIRFAGTSAGIFWAVNWLKVPGYAVAGLFDLDLLRGLAPTALLIPPGVLLGRWAVRRLPARPFEVLVLIGMVVGAGLLLAT